MRDYCKFCQYKNPHHTDACVRNEPGAEERYHAGWIEGRQGRERTSQDPAHAAGWLRGDIARDEAENGCPW